MTTLFCSPITGVEYIEIKSFFSITNNLCATNYSHVNFHWHPVVYIRDREINVCVGVFAECIFSPRSSSLARYLCRDTLLVVFVVVLTALLCF